MPQGLERKIIRWGKTSEGVSTRIFYLPRSLIDISAPRTLFYFILQTLQTSTAGLECAFSVPIYEINV